MDEALIRAHLARLAELVKKDDGGPEALPLVLNLLEDFLVGQKRQTDLLEALWSTAQFFENQRREGR